MGDAIAALALHLSLQQQTTGTQLFRLEIKLWPSTAEYKSKKTAKGSADRPHGGCNPSFST